MEQRRGNPMDKIEKYKRRLINTYLKKIKETYHPNKIYLTGSAVKGNWDETSDLDFIVDSPQPIDPDQIIGAIDIIPCQYATEEMLNNSMLLYERKRTKNTNRSASSR